MSFLRRIGIARNREDTWKLGLVLLLILVNSAFHFGTSTEYRYLHEIYQRIYYIPILLAAFWYGPFLGLASALLVTTFYIVHIQMDWHHTPFYSFNQYAEIVLYNAVALIIGFLSKRERTQRERLEATSEELSAAYEQLRSTFEQLRRADRLAALGELSAGIAHELRNPLSSVKGSIEIIGKELPSDHPKQEFVQIIKEETARLNSIVTEFLKFARPPRPSVEEMDLKEVLRSTVKLVLKEAEQSKIQIEEHYQASLPAICVDPQQMRQVFLNILINAIQAMPRGGKIRIRLRQDDDYAGIVAEFEDDGSGVARGDMDRLFDPFFSTKPQGTGLGLSISHQLIENHGGEIRAWNNEEGGLTVQVVLPLAPLGSTRAGVSSTMGGAT